MSTQMTRRIPSRNKKEPDIKRLPPNADKARGSHSHHISFSFRYLSLNHAKFNIDGKTTHYFRKLMDRLKDVSGMEASQFTNNKGKTLRCNSIEWQDTTEKSFGIPNEDDIVEEPRQFSVSANEHGRVHGFFIENVFYVVWLDPDHKLYSK